MCRFTHSSIVLLLSVKQGYDLPFGDKFTLNESAYSGMLLVYVKRLQHGANGGFAYGITHAF